MEKLKKCTKYFIMILIGILLFTISFYFRNEIMRFAAAFIGCFFVVPSSFILFEILTGGQL